MLILFGKRYRWNVVVYFVSRYRFYRPWIWTPKGVVLYCWGMPMVCTVVCRLCSSLHDMSQVKYIQWFSFYNSTKFMSIKTIRWEWDQTFWDCSCRLSWVCWLADSESSDWIHIIRQIIDILFKIITSLYECRIVNSCLSGIIYVSLLNQEE